MRLGDRYLDPLMESLMDNKAEGKKRLKRELDDTPTMYALPLGKIIVLAVCAVVFGLIKLLFER